MIIYAIWNIPEQAFLRWGVNGGSKEGYCPFRGHKCFFNTRKAAELAVEAFDRPEDYEIRIFAEQSKD